MASVPGPHTAVNGTSRLRGAPSAHSRAPFFQSSWAPNLYFNHCSQDVPDIVDSQSDDTLSLLSLQLVTSRPNPSADSWWNGRTGLQAIISDDAASHATWNCPSHSVVAVELSAWVLVASLACPCFRAGLSNRQIGTYLRFVASTGQSNGRRR